MTEKYKGLSLPLSAVEPARLFVIADLIRNPRLD
jgi:hypothetical protein